MTETKSTFKTLLEIYNSNAKSLTSMTDEEMNAFLHIMPELKKVESALKKEIKEGNITLDGIKVGEPTISKSLNPTCSREIFKEYVKTKKISDEFWLANCISISYSGIIQGLMEADNITKEAAEEIFDAKFKDHIIEKQREGTITAVKGYFEDKQAKKEATKDTPKPGEETPF